MAVLVHLSDLHLRSDASSAQRTLLDLLVASIARERAARGDHEPALVAITGDVFDSGTDHPERAIKAFLALHARIVEALGGAAPTVVLPGNHDRRRAGILGPHRPELFDALLDAADPEKIFVAGCKTPFLAELVPPAFHGLDAHVVAYDSSYLPGGLVSAGGTIRHEDLLQVNARLPADDKPLLVLVHHHLIPTPLTDVSGVETSSKPRLAKWLLAKALPALVSHGDREELTMTALGAGTALSTLHAFGRAVLLLHGHKHFPTARLVRGVIEGSGDVLIASAGSAGTRERVHAARHPDAARLWPSYNLVDLDDRRARVEVVSFSPKNAVRSPLRRDLVVAAREGARWTPELVSPRVKNGPPRVALDEATFVLAPEHGGDRDFWDYTCTRRVELHEGAELRRYVDFVHASPLARAIAGAPVKGKSRPRVPLSVGGETRYHAERGLSRTLAASERAHGPGAPFEWVGLLSRYGGTDVRLTLARRREIEPFASVTDLATGRERPATLEASDDAWSLRVEACPARTLLRIHWPLER